MKKRRVVICGGGPHSKVVLDILLQHEAYEIEGILDSGRVGPFGIPIIGTDADMPRIRASGVECAFAAIGNNAVRARVCAALRQAGFELINVIAADAILSPRSQYGSGILVNHGAIVNAGSTIGDGAILNTGCTVDHDCSIGAYAHIAPGVHISGSTRVGSLSFLGVGSCVKDCISIGDGVMIGAGAAVVRDIPSHCTAVGVPARIIHKKSETEE